MNPYLLLKGKSSKTVSEQNIAISCLYFKQKSLGLKDFISNISGVIDTANTGFGCIRSEYLGAYEAICETSLTR
jgi:hypothetical protein